MTTSREHRYALPTGHRLGEYRIDRYLGSGGFGITYLVTDENLDLQVAIKEYLPSDYAVREADHAVDVKSAADRDDFEWGRERFLEEARSLAQFDHPNIVRAQRFLEAHGTSYIVMDYVEGEPLSELLERKGTLTEAEIRRSVLPIADGLAEVHRAGLLHRDIKPSNIVVRADGAPVLIDFGSARQATGMRSRSVTSVVTPCYAPPEQYGTKSRQGPATDIYALGAVLYRCVTGRRPDDATDRLIKDEQVPAALAAIGDYSADLLAAIDAALALRMEDRPQYISRLLDELQNRRITDEECLLCPVEVEESLSTTPCERNSIAFRTSGSVAVHRSHKLPDVENSIGASDSKPRESIWKSKPFLCVLLAFLIAEAGLLGQPWLPEEWIFVSLLVMVVLLQWPGAGVDTQTWYVEAFAVAILMTGWAVLSGLW